MRAERESTYVIESVRLLVGDLSRCSGRLSSYLAIPALPERRLLHHLLLGAASVATPIVAAAAHGIRSSLVVVLWLVHRVSERIDRLLDNLLKLLLLLLGSVAAVLWLGWIGGGAHADHRRGGVI